MSESTVVQQPLPIESPIVKADDGALSTTLASSAHPSSRPRPLTRVKFSFLRLLRFLDITLILIFRVFLVLGGGIGVILIVCLIVIILFGSTALNGACMVLIGNAILRAAHLAHYTHNKGAAEIGAVGGIIGFICIGCLAQFIGFSDENQKGLFPKAVSMLVTVVIGTLSGAIGSAVLLHNHVDLGGGMDILHATRAGALGGTIMGPGMIFIGPLLAVAMGIVLSPLWILTFAGVEWCIARSTERITSNSHSYTICYCAGSSGRDPEIAAQIEELHAIERRHRAFADRFSNIGQF